MSVTKFVQYYDPFLKDWFVSEESGTDKSIRALYKTLEVCGVREHCSIYKVRA